LTTASAPKTPFVPERMKALMENRPASQAPAVKVPAFHAPAMNVADEDRRRAALAVRDPLIDDRMVAAAVKKVVDEERTTASARRVARKLARMFASDLNELGIVVRFTESTEKELALED